MMLKENEGPGDIIARLRRECDEAQEHANSLAVMVADLTDERSEVVVALRRLLERLDEE